MWMLKLAWQMASFSIDELYIQVMPTSQPWELAVDAALDFIDRLNEGRVRKYADPWALMSDCVSAARRQR
jgi:hypothetical protein